MEFEHEHEPTIFLNPHIGSKHCKFCGQVIVPDYEWNVWVTEEEDAAKQKRKEDHLEECRIANEEFRASSSVG